MDAAAGDDDAGNFSVAPLEVMVICFVLFALAEMRLNKPIK